MSADARKRRVWSMGDGNSGVAFCQDGQSFYFSHGVSYKDTELDRKWLDIKEVRVKCMVLTLTYLDMVKREELRVRLTLSRTFQGVAEHDVVEKEYCIEFEQSNPAQQTAETEAGGAREARGKRWRECRDRMPS